MTSVEKRLAEAVLMSDWFSRRQALRDGERDETSCSLCQGHGWYHDYGLDWHDARCPIRLAAATLGTTQPLDASNRLWAREFRRRDRRKKVAA